MRDESPHDALPDLVRELIEVGAITEEQYARSALSQRLVLSLVLSRKMTAERAYSLSMEGYKSSALSNPRIHMLVLDNKITVDHALTIPAQEADDNAFDYLKTLEDRTPIQERRFLLYQENPCISPYYVELIIFLRLKTSLSPIEKRELDLLLDPNSRGYAQKIIDLEAVSCRSPREDRSLALLLNRSARPYSMEIARLEFKKERAVEDSIYLEKLYLKVCCNIPQENPAMLTLRRFMLDLSKPAPRSVAFFQMDNSDTLLNLMRRRIDFLVEKEIVLHYLNLCSIPQDLRETEAMRVYIADKISLCRLGILKYFVGHPGLDCDDARLRAVVAIIQQKINTKELLLSDNEKLSNLAALLSESTPDHSVTRAIFSP